MHIPPVFIDTTAQLRVDPCPSQHPALQPPQIIANPALSKNPNDMNPMPNVPTIMTIPTSHPRTERLNDSHIVQPDNDLKKSDPRSMQPVPSTIQGTTNKQATSHRTTNQTTTNPTPNIIINSHQTQKPSASEQRNLNRFTNTVVRDTTMVNGKSQTCTSIHDTPPPAGSLPHSSYLPNDPAKIFTEKLHPPQKQPARRRLDPEVLKTISDTMPPAPAASPFRYDLSLEAAIHNSSIIASHDHDLEQVFAAYPVSILSPGSEFRPIDVLEQLLGTHPNWPRLRETLLHGAVNEVKSSVDDFHRQLENDAIIDYNNHSSTHQRLEAYNKMIGKDAKRGYSFPVTIECAKRLRHGRIGPVGMARHNGINEFGDLIPKDRLTHDQSWSCGFCPSLNDLIDQELLTELVYGWCLPRLFHAIIALREAFPNLPILIGKYDLDKAYRRITNSGEASAQCVTIDGSGKFAHVSNRLTFGGSANPSKFSDLSETATDLCNELAQLDEWNPSICESPLQHKVGPPRYVAHATAPKNPRHIPPTTSIPLTKSPDSLATSNRSPPSPHPANNEHPAQQKARIRWPRAIAPL